LLNDKNFKIMKTIDWTSWKVWAVIALVVMIIVALILYFTVPDFKNIIITISSCIGSAAIGFIGGYYMCMKSKK